MDPEVGWFPLRTRFYDIGLQLATTMLPLALVLWAIPSGLAPGAPPVPAGNTPLVGGLHLRVKKEEASS